MTKNVKKLSQDDYAAQIVDEFLKKTINVILNTRLIPEKQKKINTKNSLVKKILKKVFLDRKF